MSLTPGVPRKFLPRLSAAVVPRLFLNTRVAEKIDAYLALVGALHKQLGESISERAVCDHAHSVSHTATQHRRSFAPRVSPRRQEQNKAGAQNYYGCTADSLEIFLTLHPAASMPAGTHGTTKLIPMTTSLAAAGQENRGMTQLHDILAHSLLFRPGVPDKRRDHQSKTTAGRENSKGGRGREPISWRFTTV